MQTATSRIWTRFAAFIFFDDNRYTMSDFYAGLFDAEIIFL